MKIINAALDSWDGFIEFFFRVFFSFWNRARQMRRQVCDSASRPSFFFTELPSFRSVFIFIFWNKNDSSLVRQRDFRRFSNAFRNGVFRDAFFLLFNGTLSSSKCERKHLWTRNLLFIVMNMSNRMQDCSIKFKYSHWIKVRIASSSLWPWTDFHGIGQWRRIFCVGHRVKTTTKK